MPTFRTTLDSAGKNAAGFRVPPEVVAALGKGKRPPVRVTINGYTYRNTVAVYGDEYLIGVAMEHRGPAGVQPGDVMDVTLELDTEPRAIEVPEDLAAALEAAPAAKARFATLSNSNARAVADLVSGAKTPETRQRRIDKAIASLREGGIGR
jgi:hypothetical protein